jgi:hypothetical protein
MGRPFFYVKCCSDIVGDNVAVREGARKDMSTGNKHRRGQCCSERGSEEGYVNGQLLFSERYSNKLENTFRTV